MLPSSSTRGDTHLALDPRMLPHVEKDVDDPSDTSEVRAGTKRQTSTTFTTLTRLLGSYPAASPEASRASSYINSTQQESYQRQTMATEIAPLHDHLLTRGLRDGRHSDITVKAFGTCYKLHRIILDRSPFFATALSGPWLEASSKEIEVHPDEIDVNITKQSFELALKRLYRGHADAAVEDECATGLFATGCWLEMPDLIDASIDAILRQMNTRNLGQLITLVTSSYYGRAGDKILASAKAMLCREGWRMSTKFWDDVPSEVVQELVASDGFFVSGEWERWLLARKLLNRRLLEKCSEIGLDKPVGHSRAQETVTVGMRAAIRPGAETSVEHTAWSELYLHAQISPLLSLLDYGVHYVHLGFEQLQFIRQAKDCLGRLLMPEKIISNALWQQMELRQRVMNAKDSDLALGLAIEARDGSSPSSNSMFNLGIQDPPQARVKVKEKSDEASIPHNADSESTTSITQLPPVFWIPASDCNIVIGGNADPVYSTPNPGISQREHRSSGRVQSEDSAFQFDTTVTHDVTQPDSPDSTTGRANRSPLTYSTLPPFRFSAEFPTPRVLKEKKRVYSRTVFYAGSLWNIYIQKVASTRNMKQLGVYLHRAKEQEMEEAVFAAGVSNSQLGNVEGRIGRIENHLRDHGRAYDHTTDHFYTPDNTRRRNGRRPAQENTGSSPRSSGDQARAQASSPSMTQLLWSHPSDNEALTSDDNNEIDADSSDIDQHTPTFGVPAIPPYVDARPTIKTYFKIYSPSRGGRMLSVYESAPDKFNFSQSWGWKSSTLMLDEGLMSSDEVQQHIDVTEGFASAEEGREEGTADFTDVQLGLLKEEGVSSSNSRGGYRDGKLRFTVVIGNI